MHWVWLTLICAAALASADAATKAWLRGMSATRLLLVRFSLSGLMLLPWLLSLPALGSLSPALWGWLAILLPLELSAMALYLIAIRDHPLSLTLPYLAFTPAFVLVIAFFLLGETSTWLGALGVLFIVAGAWLLNAGAAEGKDWRGWLRPLQAILWEPGSRLMLGVALIYAVTASLSKAALTYLEPTQFGALYFALLGALALGIFFVTEVWRTRRPAGTFSHPASPGIMPDDTLLLGSNPSQRVTQLAPWHLAAAVVLVAALNALMVLTHFLAIEQANVAYMIAVKRTSLLFGLLYGFVCFREPRMRQRLPAAGLMLIGVFLIAGSD
ncbi:EamA-like transporter family protein [Thiorhodovibrio winogradskyi]|uniref:EamA-like transporter family protein n=1 Tax=Thiorhodovibrio winogradskyi TaxID=77007 RepID=A0ABZ0S916_9GAMM|nr:EamA family transporter [Thiorhodovibrio winogradskyi]